MKESHDRMSSVTASSFGALGEAAGPAPQSPPLARAVQRNAAGLWRFFLLRSDRHTAEDLMQETALQAARSLRPDLDGQELDRWLFGVARNVLRRHWRTRRRRNRNLPHQPGDPDITLAEHMDAGPLPQEVAQSNEARRELLLGLSKLPGPQQELLLDVYARGLSQQDLAGKLGLSVRAVEGRLYRARQALREQLNEFEDLT